VSDAGHLQQRILQANYMASYQTPSTEDTEPGIEQKPFPLILHLDPIQNGGHDTKLIGRALRQWLRWGMRDHYCCYTNASSAACRWCPACTFLLPAAGWSGSITYRQKSLGSHWMTIGQTSKTYRSTCRRQRSRWRMSKITESVCRHWLSTHELKPAIPCSYH
jgi:hypothetical protein